MVIRTSNKLKKKHETRYKMQQARGSSLAKMRVSQGFLGTLVKYRIEQENVSLHLGNRERKLYKFNRGRKHGKQIY